MNGKLIITGTYSIAPADGEGWAPNPGEFDIIVLLLTYANMNNKALNELTHCPMRRRAMGAARNRRVPGLTARS